MFQNVNGSYTLPESPNFITGGGAYALLFQQL